MNPRLAGLYGITDPQLLTDNTVLVAGVEAALEGGMRVLQYRAKSLSADIRREQARQLRDLCRRYDALMIINDDVELASAVQADGVHLGRDDLELLHARQRLGSAAIIGCSCYDQLPLALQAQQQGADYVAFGRFFASRSKPEASPADPMVLSRAHQQLAIPICAIGGITSDNASPLIEQGADMLAVIHDLFAAADIYQKSLLFNRLFGSNDAGFCVE